MRSKSKSSTISSEVLKALEPLGIVISKLWPISVNLREDRMNEILVPGDWKLAISKLFRNLSVRGIMRM